MLPGFSLDVSDTIKAHVYTVTVIVNLRWFKDVLLNRQFSLQSHCVLYEDCRHSRPKKEKSLAKQGTSQFLMALFFFCTLSLCWFDLMYPWQQKPENSTETVIHHQPKRSRESFPSEAHLCVLMEGSVWEMKQRELNNFISCWRKDKRFCGFVRLMVDMTLHNIIKCMNKRSDTDTEISSDSHTVSGKLLYSIGGPIYRPICLVDAFEVGLLFWRRAAHSAHILPFVFRHR